MKKDWIKLLIIVLPVLGILCIILFSLTVFGTPFQLSKINFFLAAFSILILTGISSSILGAGLGFLFGVPKRNIEYKTKDNRYIPNTNLEQVSDWLIKILIGVGLTQLSSISNKIYSISKEIGSGLTTISDKAEPIFVACIIIYFFVSGFLISYLLTRLRLYKVFEENEA